MTEFSKEYIALLQRLLENSPYKQITIQSNLFKHVVDEIERLQAENDLLQTNRKCLNRDLAKAQLHAQELQQKKIFFQELSNNWSKRYYKVIDEQRNRIALLEQAKEMMEAEIKESNGLLRSAFMIAKRDGNKTNWEAWRKQLYIALERQHAMMYKQQESDEMIRFTSARIKNIRWSIENNQTSKELMTEMIDEIERLQSLVHELEFRIEWLDGDRKQLSEKVFSANKRVKELKQKLENKCANCGLASHDIWGDEDNVYDNLSTEEE